MSPSQRNVELAKREDFFSDPFFSDILKESDDLFQKRIVAFKDHKIAAPSKGGDSAHNLQVSASNDSFLIQLELPGFLPEDFNLKTKDDVIILEANHKSGDGDQETTRKYLKEFKMPQGVLRDQITSAYTSEGVLTIQAPRKIDVPEGAEVSEAMTAASKAYTTDDGTKVAQDSSASSQMIATSTKSDDGSSSSSMSFSSSKSSSSTMTSSSTGPGGMPGMMMPSMSMGGSQMPNMDDMMKNMMSKMNMGGGDMGSMMSNMKSGNSMMSSSSSMMSSSSMTSSSSSSSILEKGSSSSMMPPPLRMQMPQMPGLNIEEMSTAGTDVSAPPSYTVTSPPPSRMGEEMNHTVSSSNFKASDAKSADATVLLKLKEGDEYKLVLNMQQYKPENIVVKLNDRELTITAEEGATENFYQKHIVPSGIDLEQLTSSFSSDGILVIKAPKVK